MLYPAYMRMSTSSRAVGEFTDEVYNSCMDKEVLTKVNIDTKAHEQCMYAKNIASLAAFSKANRYIFKEDWLKRETEGKDNTVKEIYKILGDKAYALPQYKDAYLKFKSY